MPDPMTIPDDPSSTTGTARSPEAACKPCAEPTGQSAAVVPRRTDGVEYAIVELRPRVDDPPTGLLDIVDRHLNSATASDVALGRYMTLFRAVRNAGAAAIAFAGALWAAGVYMVTYYGVPPWAAGGLGLGAPAVASCIGWGALRRRARRRVRRHGPFPHRRPSSGNGTERNGTESHAKPPSRSSLA